MDTLWGVLIVLVIALVIWLLRRSSQPSRGGGYVPAGDTDRDADGGGEGGDGGGDIFGGSGDGGFGGGDAGGGGGGGDGAD